MIEILLFFIAFFFFFFLSYSYPTLFIIFIIVVSTNFLGIFPENYFGQITSENIIFIASISVVPSIFLKKNLWKVDRYAMRLLFFPIIMIMFFLYGFFSPAVNDYSYLYLSVIDGKQLFSYTLIIYIFIFHKKIDLYLIFNSIIFIAFILSSYVIVSLLFGVYPPGYLPVNPNGITIHSNIHIRYPIYILLAFFIILSKRVFENKYNYLMLFFLFLGLFFQSHDSMKICFLIMFFLFYLINLEGYKNKYFIAALSFIFILFLMLNVDQYNEALLSRLLINSYRLDYINESLVFGYGFIHEYSFLGVDFNPSSTGLHDKKMATIDSGFIDILIRFGFFGLIIIVSFFFLFCFRLLRLSCNNKIFVFFLFLFIPVMLTWSMLTYIHGILTIGIVLLIVLKERQHD